MLTGPEIIEKVAISIAVGALIGIEREMSQRAKGELVAGVRTFSLISLFGLTSGIISDMIGTNLFIITSLVISAAVSLSGYFMKVRETKGIGLTTSVAFIVTFSIGVICYFEPRPLFITVSLGVITALILAVKEYTQKFAQQVAKKEVRDALIFALLAFVILPVLPDKAVDPFGALNPHLIWLTIILVLSVGFAGYAFVKIFGVKRGLTITGLFGGLASSMSVAVNMAENVRANGKILHSATFAVVIASSTMFLRVVAISAVINYRVGMSLLLPIASLALVGYLMSYFVWRSTKQETPELKIASPLSLVPALKFSVFFAAILLATQLTRIYLPNEAIFAVSFIAGLVDVDATTVSLSSLALTGLPVSTATNGIIIAVLSNTLSKWFVIRWLSNSKMSADVGKLFAVIIAVGVALLLVPPLL